MEKISRQKMVPMQVKIADKIKKKYSTTVLYEMFDMYVCNPGFATMKTTEGLA